MKVTMRELENLQGQRFDVIVLGGGINGASAVQNLAAAGYKCLIVEKEDFGSGASGRSARMLHPGLRFFEVANPLAYFARHPGRFVDALRGARQAMCGVAEHLRDGGDRIWSYRMCFPIYEDSEFKSWHLKAGLKLLSALGDGSFSFDEEVVRREDVSKVPFLSDLANLDRLKAVAVYNEFKFDWPERFCADMVLDAERNGAVAVNYCEGRLQDRGADGDWRVKLSSLIDGFRDEIEVSAPVVLNMAGTWMDDLLPGESSSPPLIEATKGVHLVVEMPETYQGFGFASLNSEGTPFYVLPHHKNLFTIGVTETPFSGDAGDAACTDQEADFLIEETNRVLPGRKLSRKDVLWTWAGVRPLTATPAGLKVGRAPRTLHDLGDRGMPGVLALTGGPIMTHRSAGREVLDAVSARIKPGGSKAEPDMAPFAFSDTDNSPPFLPDEPEVRVADLEHAVLNEHARTLTDVLLRRTGLAWRRPLTLAESVDAAKLLSSHLGWDEHQIEAEVETFMNFQQQTFRRPASLG